MAPGHRHRPDHRSSAPAASAPRSSKTGPRAGLTSGPRRTAVAAVVRPTDHGLPCAALHLSGVSDEDGVTPSRHECQRLGRRRGGVAVSLLAATGPIRSHPDARTCVADGLQTASSRVSRRAQKARNPCKSAVDRRGVETLTSAVPKRRSGVMKRHVHKASQSGIFLAFGEDELLAEGRR